MTDQSEIVEPRDSSVALPNLEWIIAGAALCLVICIVILVVMVRRQRRRTEAAAAVLDSVHDVAALPHDARFGEYVSVAQLDLDKPMDAVYNSMPCTDDVLYDNALPRDEETPVVYGGLPADVNEA